LSWISGMAGAIKDPNIRKKVIKTTVSVLEIIGLAACGVRGIITKTAESTSTNFPPTVEITEVPTEAPTVITTDVPAGSETQVVTEAAARQSVTVEDVKNVEPSLKLGVDETGGLTGLPENTSEDMTQAVRSFYDAISEKFPGSAIYFDQDTEGSGQWILYAISPNGNLIHQVVSYAGGPEQFADYPFAYGRNETTNEWEVTGNYVETNTSGSVVGVIWEGLPQFLKGRISLSGGDSVFTKFMEYKKYANEDPFLDVDGIDQLVPKGVAGELLAFPGVTYNESGLHLTLADSSRVIDVATTEIEKQVIFDSEYNLYKIYDAEGHITAEYDPGQGVEGDADYVPATGWVDIQKIAKDLVCDQGGNCSAEASNSPISGAVNVEMESTGVARYIDAIDQSTGEKIGNFLVLQMVTKKNGSDILVPWVLLQGESNSEKGVNAFPYGVRTIKYRVEGKGSDMPTLLTLYPVQKWLDWMHKGSQWKLQFSKDSFTYNKYMSIVKTSQIMNGENQNEAIDLLSNNVEDYNKNTILVFLASSP
jgi:hypothetical protein